MCVHKQSKRKISYNIVQLITQPHFPVSPKLLYFSALVPCRRPGPVPISGQAGHQSPCAALNTSASSTGRGKIHVRTGGGGGRSLQLAARLRVAFFGSTISRSPAAAQSAGGGAGGHCLTGGAALDGDGGRTRTGWFSLARRARAQMRPPGPCAEAGSLLARPRRK